MFDHILKRSHTDLMKRHAASHIQPRDSKRRCLPSYPKNGRVSQACKTCAASKLKCDEEKPCRRCREKKLVCNRAQNGTPIDTSPPRPQRQASQSDQTPHLPADASQVHATFPPPIDGQIDQYPNEMVSPNAEMNNHVPVGLQSGSSTDDRNSVVFSVDGTFFPDCILESLIPSLSRTSDLDPLPVLPQDYFHTELDHNVDFDFDLTDVDYGVIDLFNSRGAVHHNAHNSDGANDCGDGDSGIAIGAEAYHRSSLSAWKPAHEDHAFADQVNLSVSEAIDSPEANFRPDRRILSERLSPSGRDLIFGMVLQTSQRANLTRIMKSFPSSQLLDSLIQYYFESQSYHIDSWIHGPTFRMKEEPPDILAALAAAGAARSTIPTSRRLGYALMEIVRLQMSVKYESDNSTTRDLRASQTFALAIDVGLWSGNARRTEIAESFQQPLVTMLRRALRFRRSVYSNIAPSADDDGDVLEKKWREWAHSESFNRLIHHMFLHDAQSAMMLNVNPIISYSELELPLPAPRSLWEAKSAKDWKEAYLASGLSSRGRTPSLVDSLQDLSQLSAYQSRIDLQLSTLALIHGLSTLVSEYHRQKCITKDHSKHWNALVISSRHQELTQALQHLRMLCFEMSSALGPGIVLVFELISMFLHMSLEELQLFAGKEDKNEARRVYHSAIEWISSIDSRRAIWHAGQVVRAAKVMPPGALTRFFALGVYYASLAFWSYSVVSKAKNCQAVVGSPQSDPQFRGPWPTVYLDGEETTDVQRFISLGCGCPALHAPSGAAVIADPSQIMDAIQTLLRGDAHQDNLSPFVQGLCQLMCDLGNAAYAST
ncbi:hypothetical protein IFM58399_09858 [Aspergillus lentulus]|uniref:putative C6 and C2H2 transcription factor RegA-like n=1 Tax=Aspergillus lentulus TaxID=293939 RepID=UPI001394D23D|nr:uncharacterized protein IFM58399_09858 [Aspergillus lentulus]KAF4178983.1 hypothetical protein CNMCM8060_003743 [Aspergillus lentulus]KAF4191185.1 hypothetical protein CNMCM8694_002269 [Aspergillus lentulus]GFF54579.1 hypothetical protein IFM58399_09858 [Aspergillus lentulus]GFF58229.1 hypothetical protein IFM62136_03724 [Aspergillus lentulus]